MHAPQAMKADVSVKRMAAFAKRLLQIAAHAPAPFAAGILFLLSELLKVGLASRPSQNVPGSWLCMSSVAFHGRQSGEG